MSSQSILYALDRWVWFGIYPGGFLNSVLENNLRDSIARCDSQNVKKIAKIVRFIYHNCPGNCWGNQNSVKTWAEMDDEVRLSLVGRSEYPRSRPKHTGKDDPA